LLELSLLQLGVGEGELVALVGHATEPEDVLDRAEPCGGARGPEGRQHDVENGSGRRGGGIGGQLRMKKRRLRHRRSNEGVERLAPGVSVD